MYGLCPWVWSGRVADKVRGSIWWNLIRTRLCRRPGRRRGHVWSGRVRVVEFTKDTTRPNQRQGLVGPVPNSTTRTRAGPDPTRPDKIRELVGNPRRPNRLCRRPGSPINSGRVRLVEFGHNSIDLLQVRSLQFSSVQFNLCVVNPALGSRVMGLLFIVTAGVVMVIDFRIRVISLTCRLGFGVRFGLESSTLGGRYPRW